jgi:hypothetical protein
VGVVLVAEVFQSGKNGFGAVLPKTQREPNFTVKAALEHIEVIWCPACVMSLSKASIARAFRQGMHLPQESSG